MKYILIRDVSEHMKQGTIVYDYGGYTYGCISSKGEAFTMEDGKTPFFEIPRNAVRPYSENQRIRKEKLNHLNNEIDL